MKQKLKSKRGAVKRFKVTGTGKVKAMKMGRRHILTTKTQKLKRQMRRGTILAPCDAKKIKPLLLK